MRKVPSIQEQIRSRIHSGDVESFRYAYRWANERNELHMITYVDRIICLTNTLHAAYGDRSFPAMRYALERSDLPLGALLIAALEYARTGNEAVLSTSQIEVLDVLVREADQLAPDELLACASKLTL